MIEQRPRWSDREHGVGRGAERGRRATGVLGHEGRRDQPDPDDGRRVGSASDPGQRCVPRRGLHRAAASWPTGVDRPLAGEIQPWPERGQPEMIADVAVWLASDAVAVRDGRGGHRGRRADGGHPAADGPRPAASPADVRHRIRQHRPRPRRPPAVMVNGKVRRSRPRIDGSSICSPSASAGSFDMISVDFGSSSGPTGSHGSSFEPASQFTLGRHANEWALLGACCQPATSDRTTASIRSLAVVTPAAISTSSDRGAVPARFVPARPIRRST